MALSSSACYEVDWSCVDQDTLSNTDAEVVARAEIFALAAIRILTGFQAGVCPVTIRPCIARCRESKTWLTAEGGDMPWTPYIFNGQWLNSCGCQAKSCSCTNLTEIALEGPVGGVFEVKVDGIVQDQTDYRVDNLNRLVRLGGEEWPICQDMSLQDTEVGTMSVSYSIGVPWDSTAAFIAGVMAKEYLNACTGGDCRLPSNVVSVTRQGATIELDKDLFPNMTTGIYEVDIWVRSINPYAAKGVSGVFSPDRPLSRQTTWRA